MKEPPDPRRYDRQVRFGRMLGLFFVTVGFATIAFGWHGTAKNALIDKQLPYLMSGGATGVGLVALGVGLLVMAQFRNERIKLGERLEQLGAVISKAVAAGGGQTAANGQVVAGKSTYHRPECRLLAGKGDLDFVSIDLAKLQGLSPCRVCNPMEEDIAAAQGEGRKTTAAARREASPRRSRRRKATSAQKESTARRK